MVEIGAILDNSKKLLVIGVWGLLYLCVLGWFNNIMSTAYAAWGIQRWTDILIFTPIVEETVRFIFGRYSRWPLAMGLLQGLAEVGNLATPFSPALWHHFLAGMMMQMYPRWRVLLIVIPLHFITNSVYVATMISSPDAYYITTLCRAGAYVIVGFLAMSAFIRHLKQHGSLMATGGKVVILDNSKKSPKIDVGNKFWQA